MRYYLYIFNDNWAAEIGVEGFAALTEDQKDIAIAKIKRQYKNGGTLCFSINNDKEYDNLNDILACISWSEITSAQYRMLIYLFRGIFGQLGPLNISELGEDENEIYEDYGVEPSDGDNNLCESCRVYLEEKEDEDSYDREADNVSKFIEKEYGIIKTENSDFHSIFRWKPTPKAYIKITIPAYQQGDDVELTLTVSGKEMRYEFFYLDDISGDPEGELSEIIKEMIEKAKKYE